MKECKVCNIAKEEVDFTDQNGLHNICNKCRGSVKQPKVAEEIKVSNKPVNVKSTKK